MDPTLSLQEQFSSSGGSAALIVGGTLAGILIVSAYLLFFAKKLWRGHEMRRKTKLSKEVCEIIEDKIVCALTIAITPYEITEVSSTTGKPEKKTMPARMTLDEAREVYAKLARLGFWGLHPRKFNPAKTPLELNELKEQLKAQRAARASSSGSKALDKLLGGDLSAELS